MEIKEEWIKESKVNSERYTSLYKESIENGDEFWNKHGGRIDWYEKYTKIRSTKYSNKELIMKCLIAGAGGFIGGHLMQRLKLEGHQIICVDIKPFDSLPVHLNIIS